MAQVVAEKNVGVVNGFFVADAVGDCYVGDHRAAFKVAELVVEFAAGDDDRVGRIGAVSARVEVVGAADGCGQVVLRAVEG